MSSGVTSVVATREVFFARLGGSVRRRAQTVSAAPGKSAQEPSRIRMPRLGFMKYRG